MCIGIPMQVVSCRGSHADCLADGQLQSVDLSLVGPQPAGSWVLVFLGAARESLTHERAQQIRQALSAMQAVMQGSTANLDSLFADLVEREPQLPPHLQPVPNNKNH